MSINNIKSKNGLQKMIKIKICEVAPRGACSYYRSIGPFSKLHKINPEIECEYIEGVSWHTLADADILFLARPYQDNYVEAIEFAKSFGVKTWIDYDDALTIIPEDNPGYGFFSSEVVEKNIKKAISTADIVTVSTEGIKNIYSKLNSDIRIIENAFNDYNYPFEKRENSTKYISWRGSNTHRRDLLSVREDMISTSKQFPDWAWNFIGGGGDLWFITDKINNCMTIVDVEIVRYNRLIHNLQPEIHVCPLLDSEFNRGKSNIAFIEATWAGAVCVAPTIPEFIKPGCVNYTDNFKYIISKLIKSRTFRQENYEKSFEYVRDNLLLSVINKKRIKIIEEVLR
jgi:HEPN domain-containing protein